MQRQDALDQLAKELRRASARLGVERAIGAFFVPALAILAWAAVALVGLVDALPWIAQSLAALGAVSAIAYLIVRGGRAWRTPTRTEARARLAADNALAQDAFEALDDRPARYEGASMAMWRRAQARARLCPQGPRWPAASRPQAPRSLPAALAGAWRVHPRRRVRRRRSA